MTRGSETPNHMQRIAIMVVNGTAPEDFWPQMKKLRRKQVPNVILG